jgi:NAD(P)H-dependent FMN reductase
MRVALCCAHQLAESHHDVTLIDPLDYDLSDPFTPLFSYGPGQAPADLQQLAQHIKNADAYVMVSPEYNHAMSPALAHLLNHFGSSLFSYKPSVIVTYSAGQWGGVRAAVNLRTFLSELGCLPVSAMIHLPHAQKVLSDTGTYLDGVSATDWKHYFERAFSQLQWWGMAANKHRDSDEGKQQTPAFTGNPLQRNAP